MASTLINTTVILNEMLALLTTENNAIRAVNRQYDSRFAAGGVSGKPGTSLQVRKPIEVLVRSGRAINVQDTVEESVTINCATQKGVDLPAFTSEQLTMNIDDFSNRYLKPAATRLAAQIDADICAAAGIGTGQSVGSVGSVPSSELTWATAMQKLHEANVPSDGRITALLDPESYMKTATIISAKYQPNGAATGAFRRGVIESNYGIDFAMDQNISSLTVGSRAGTILIDTPLPSTEGATTIHIDGLSSAVMTIKAGEVFTVADVYAVNPQSKTSYSALYQFVVQADATSASNEVDLTVLPMYVTGARQNISAFPVNDKAVTFIGTASTAYRQNLVLHKDAICLATADLVVPQGVHSAGRQTMDGISLRMITDYNVSDDTMVTRFDAYYGVTVLDPRKMVRVWGNV
jgi:hypothetical protein